MGMRRSDMQQYAAEQLALGELLRAEHRTTDLPGICTCGREAPCDERRRGNELVAQYRAWAEPQTRTVNAPYVANSRQWGRSQI